MALKDQVHIYSVDTSAFATDKEQELYYAMGRLRRKIMLIDKFIEDTKRRRNRIEKTKLSEEEECIIKSGKNKGKRKNLLSHSESLIEKCELIKSTHKKNIASIKETLKGVMEVNNYKNIVRELNVSHLKESNIIALFDSTLTRTLKLKPRIEVYTDIIVVQVYYFEVLQDLVMHGFTLNGEKYAYYGSSAGQIKTKKAVFLKESKWVKYDEHGKEIWSKEGKTLMCGLSFKEINKKSGDKGINPNKFNAYLSLNNSATDTFKGFTIDEVIVVDDWESLVNDKVDYIHTNTFEIERSKYMDVPINQMDGCGIMLPSAHDKSFMVRAPFIKGLLVPFDFIRFIEEYNASPVVKDIYGKEWNVLTDRIKCIMTKSQFKLSKYYSDWDDYKTRFKKNKCEIAYANEEESNVKNSKINYQMLQTLSNMTDDEVEYVVSKSVESIKKIAKDKDTIFRILGITDYNKNKNFLQKSIELYPPLLSDSYTRKVVKQVKDKVVKDAKSGKVEIKGKYLFMIPDLFAFCEHLFLHIENPKGLLSRGEVSCNIYRQQDKLACLRAPHLYREWGIRNNVNNELTEKWFLSNGLYMSSDDLLSKLVMNDWDSDKSLVVSDETIIEIAERHMIDINPVYYEMPIATSSELTLATRYKGLIDAYKGGGIGMYSNHITKIWNDATGDINVDLIRYLVMINNFQIDFSKTLFKIDTPKHIKKQISEKTKLKTPYFFKYVKGKTDEGVEKINNSTMNRICASIPNPKISFKDTEFGKFDYRMLMSRWDFDGLDISHDILEEYIELTKTITNDISTKNSDRTDVIPPIFLFIREQLLSKYNKDEIVDTLVLHLFDKKPTDFKLSLWQAFGDVLYENLVNNLKYRKNCERCGELIEVNRNVQKYCSKCAYVIKLENKRKK